MSTHTIHGTAASSQPRNLEAALADLRVAPDESRAEGYPPPTQCALDRAEHILRGMQAQFVGRLEVYPTQDGEVAVVAPGRPDHSVMALCDANGGVLCMANMDSQASPG